MKVKKILALSTLAVGICVAQTLPEGTKIRVRMVESLSSASATAGEKVELSVADSVVQDGRVVIPEGTRVVGSVVSAVPKRRMGRAGKLDFSVDKIMLSDDASIPVRYSVTRRSGESHALSTGIITAGLVAFVSPAGALLLLRHGKDVSINKGMTFEVFTDSAYKMKRVETAQAKLQ